MASTTKFTNASDSWKSELWNVSLLPAEPIAASKPAYARARPLAVVVALRPLSDEPDDDWRWRRRASGY